ncbi:hypothetical protein ACW2Q0_28365 [Nocardia sp. R16R-3T]
MPRTRRKSAALATRREEALALYLSGKTYQQVADELHYYDRSTAYRAISTALAESAARTDQLAEQARPIFLAKLEMLWRVNWERHEASGDPRAGELCMKVLDRFARLHGLDAPVKVEATVVTRTQLDADIEQLLAAVRELPQPQTPTAPPEPAIERTPWTPPPASQIPVPE